MRNPSPRVLANTADVYRLVTTRSALDADAGLSGTGSYAGTPDVSDAPCSAQPKSTERVETQGRVSTVVVWHVVFRSDLSLKVMDKLVLTVGTETHTVFVDGFRDLAGRQGAWTAVCVERV